jgi:hypothetical protein
LAPSTKFPAGNQGFGRLFLIVSEVSGKEFRVRKPNACQPENRAQKRAFFSFGAFWFLTVPTPLVNRVLYNPDDAREDEMSRFLGYSAS